MVMQMKKKRLIDATDLVRRVLVERDKIPLEFVPRYNLGVPESFKQGQAMRGGIRKALREIETSQTVDAVEVVRCRDCKHRGFAGECPMCYTEDFYNEDYGYDYWDVDKTVDEGFCHCGEKWDAEVEG